MAPPNAALPVIDLTKPDSQNAKEITAGAIEWGFVYIRSKGLGFDKAYLNSAFDLARKFFDTPYDEKADVACGKDYNPGGSGWSGPGREVLDPERQKRGDYKEGMTFNEFPGGKPGQKIPAALDNTDDKAALIDFHAKFRSVCIKILELFAIGLEIPEEEGGKNWFATRHDPAKGTSGSNLRFCYYPTFSDEQAKNFDPVATRASSHTDFGTITILFQLPGQPGLEVLNPDNEWEPVAVFPPGTEEDEFPPIVMNIGDLLSYWTEGVMKSTVHRVSIDPYTNRDRYSIVYFSHPVGSTELVTVPSPLVRQVLQDKGPVKRARTAKEHVLGRLDDVFGAAHKRLGKPMEKPMETVQSTAIAV
ncbi:oxidoreductase [Xylariaceae sp. FL1651]|nr:oxidoreductase [Xylariaceae sp. FL1651]